MVNKTNMKKFNKVNKNNSNQITNNKKIKIKMVRIKVKIYNKTQAMLINFKQLKNKNLHNQQILI
jgi:hypothetical protein